MRNLNTRNWVENGVYSNRLMDDRYPEHPLIVGGASHSIYENAYGINMNKTDTVLILGPKFG